MAQVELYIDKTNIMEKFNKLINKVDSDILFSIIVLLSVISVFIFTLYLSNRG